MHVYTIYVYACEKFQRPLLQSIVIVNVPVAM